MLFLLEYMLLFKYGLFCDIEMYKMGVVVEFGFVIIMEEFILCVGVVNFYIYVFGCFVNFVEVLILLEIFLLYLF